MSDTTIFTVLNAVSAASLTFVAGAMAPSLTTARAVSGRTAAAVLVPFWLLFAALQLWNKPAIEPLWLQYLLLVVAPFAVGASAALLAARHRNSASRRTQLTDASAQEPPIPDA